MSGKEAGWRSREQGTFARKTSLGQQAGEAPGDQKDTKAKGSEASPGKPGVAHSGKQKREQGRHLARSFPSSIWKLPSPGSFPRAQGGRAHPAHRPPQPEGQQEWQHPAEGGHPAVSGSSGAAAPLPRIIEALGTAGASRRSSALSSFMSARRTTSGRSIWSLLLFSRLCHRKPINQTTPSPPGLRV